jgi:hypothetical protein
MVVLLSVVRDGCVSVGQFVVCFPCAELLCLLVSMHRVINLLLSPNLPISHGALCPSTLLPRGLQPCHYVVVHSAGNSANLWSQYQCRKIMAQHLLPMS